MMSQNFKKSPEKFLKVPGKKIDALVFSEVVNASLLLMEGFCSWDICRWAIASLVAMCEILFHWSLGAWGSLILEIFKKFFTNWFFLRVSLNSAPNNYLKNNYTSAI